MTAFKLTEVKSDLFQTPQTYSLAHAVSADLNITKKGSLAWQFSVIFGQVDELSQQVIQTGNVAALEDNSRFIYFMVMKQTLYDRPTYDTLQSTLICLREHMRNHEVTKVAMPNICCGTTDGLEWQRVKKIIRNVFANEYNVEIMVCQHVPLSVPFTPKCQIIEVKGNLFTAPADFSLVHSVSADFAMCAGIGLQFKCKFGQLNELIKQHKHTGNVAVLKDHERYIYNLITKERHHERCTYVALYYALTSMRAHMHEHNVTKLAIPRLGCGIDRLNWVQVKKIFEYVFGNDKIEIVAYFYDPPTLVSRGSVTHIPSCKRYA